MVGVQLFIDWHKRGASAFFAVILPFLKSSDVRSSGLFVGEIIKVKPVDKPP